MSAPSKNWTNIYDSQVDADSPIDTTLMTSIRDNLVHLREWLGGNYTPAVDHDHDGSNSKSVVLPDSSVTLSKLKLAQGSWSTSIAGTFDVTVASCSHWPSVRVNGSGGSYVQVTGAYVADSNPGDSGTVNRMRVTASGPITTAYVYWTYHTD